MTLPFRAGILPQSWPTAGDCREAAPFHLHSYNEDFFIIRQSGCTHYEKPFLYLIFGRERTMLIDTGAGNFDVAAAVGAALSIWRERKGRDPGPLLVVHSHAHADHVAGDAAFAGGDGIFLVPAALESIIPFFGFRNWPDEVAVIDLGDRLVDVIPIPGHDPASVAFYDRETAILLPGDTLYPGRLYVEQQAEFVRSVERLVEFTRSRPLAHILGCHIENSRAPFVDYAVGTVDQPDEHELALGRAHLLELHDALQRMMMPMAREILRDFTIWPR
jgi:hydroxyacylglutathione hydrolase